MDARMRPPLLTRPFVLVSLANFTFCIAQSFSIHLPGFFQQLGAREAEIGRILGAMPLSALIAGPLVGRSLDRHGRRVTIRTGSLLYAVVAAMYLMIGSLGPFVYLVRVLEGLSYTMLYAALFTYAADVVPEERRTQGLALFGASGLVTMGISGQLGDWILQAGTYRTLLSTALGFALLSTVLCWPLRDLHRAAVQAAPAGERVSFGALLVARPFVGIWCAALTFFFAMSAVLGFLKTYVLATGHGTVGGFFLTYSLVALMLRVIFGWLPDRIGLRRMVLPALLSYALGALLLSTAGGELEVLAAGLLCGIGHSYAYPVFFSLVIERAHPAQRGAAMGIYTGVDWAGMLAAGPVTGLLIEEAGYGQAFVTLAGALGVGTVVFYGLDRREGGVKPVGVG